MFRIELATARMRPNRQAGLALGNYFYGGNPGELEREGKSASGYFAKKQLKLQLRAGSVSDRRDRPENSGR